MPEADSSEPTPQSVANRTAEPVVAPDPPGYPVNLTEELRTHEGRTVQLRAIKPSDDPAYRAFGEGLSSEAIYFRFFSPRTKMSEAEIDHFLHVDYVKRLAIVAVNGDRIVGIGRYDALADGKAGDAEVAFVVADDFQGNGIATAMLGLLARSAERNGFARLIASVLPDNNKMLHVFDDAKFPAERHLEDRVVEVVLTLVS